MAAEIPPHLREFQQTYRQDGPRAAALEWFRAARWGLFVHYGLYSLLGRHEWVQYREKIPVAEYARLAGDFTAERFDAGRIADLAVAAEMRYVNLTTRHHESFCLFDTQTTEFNSVRAPRCGRDLVAELAEACQARGLGLCLYVSHGRDWRHRHAPNNDRFGGHARPEYETPEPHYARGEEHDLDRYVQYVHDQVTELLSGYGPIAAIWLDGIAVPLRPKDASGRVREDYDPRRDGDPFRCQELYDRIHGLQEHCLVSYKQGYLHSEDFYAPERDAVDTGGKPGEICDTMMPESWGHDAALDGRHKTAEQVWAKLAEARRRGYNLLMNTGPRGDGSIHPEDEPVLRAVGERIRREGLPGQG
jgi:alpha-L-fucosidase